MSKLKTLMLGAASHEFRNPLSGLISMLSILEPTISEEMKHYLQVAKSSADLLLFLSNDFLDYAQIEAGKLRLTYERFSVYKSCLELVDMLRYKAESKGIKLLLSSNLKGIKIRSDVNRFKQIVLNLVSNAIKFTFDGQVEITGEKFKDAVTQSNYVRIRVKDTGLGIKKEDIPSLFNIFGKLD